MSRNAGEDMCAGRDLSANPETELLLSNRIHGDAPTSTCVRAQPGERRAMDDEPCHRDGASSLSSSSSSSSSSSRPTSQDKSTGSSRNAQQVEEPSSNPVTPLSITVNDAVENDDPPPYASILPPYSAIALSNHVGWPYGPFSFGDSYSTNPPPYRVEIPLAPFQTSRPSATAAFHPEETNCQHSSLPMPLMPYRFFKFGYRGDWRETWLADGGVVEKIEDGRSRTRTGINLVTGTSSFEGTMRGVRLLPVAGTKDSQECSLNSVDSLRR
ncbi:hypothetical protein EAI_01306 [Harpegnathos saltator]|uniref:Uncharacterized protein n=1 Tax=Harpegnathos saltator TaxID=610380 RepID=E2BBD9_HARSA|nr:hypothetical protein EAI_01306 [Harpegnathos saltator]